MKILPNDKEKKELIEKAIKNCKELLGVDVCYDINTFKELKEKFDNIINFILYDNNNINGNTVLYKQTIEIVLDLKTIIKTMQINKMASIKGFEFTQEQIEKTIKENNYF